MYDHPVTRWTNAIVLTILMAAVARLEAQSPRLFSRYQELHYRTEQGLPQDEVRSIAQTPDGFLWFSTRDGLARFDGLRFTVFRSEDTPGLTHNELGALLTDHLGRLWISTLNGVSCYEHGKFRHFGREDGLPNEAAHVMVEDRQGTVWFGTWGGLAAYDGKQIRAFTTKDGLPNNVVLGLADDRQGGLWVGTAGGLAFFKNGRFRTFTTKDGLPSDVIDDVLSDHTGRVWVATEQAFARLAASDRFERIDELPGSPWRLYEDHQGNVWASSTMALARLSPGQSRFQQEPLAAGEVAQAIFEDRDGSIWLGTVYSGTICYRPQPFVTFTTRDGLANNRALNFFEDSHGVLWIGTSDGLSRWSKGVIETVRTGIHIGEVHSMAEDREGRFWVGTGNGLVRFNGTKWERMRGGQVPLPVDVESLYADRRDRIWIGSGEGLVIWDHGKLTRLTEKDGLPGGWIGTIVEDRVGRIWVATSGGVAAIANGRIATYTTANGLLTNFVDSVSKTSDGAIWFCTPKGLHRWKDGKLQAFTAHDGMPLDIVTHFLEDNEGRFWIGSFRGISRIEKKDVERLAQGARFRIPYEHWSAEDGFEINMGGSANEQVMWKSRDGTLWFGTNNGVVALRPSDLRYHPSPPDPLIDSVNTDGEAARGRVLEPGVRHMEFTFTAPTSITPEHLEFRYRLDGYDREWHQAGAQRFASFTNLPKGSYSFRVSVRRNGGSWNPTEATVGFRILPYWYETWGFRISCGLFVLLALWMVHEYRLRQTRERLKLVLQERSRVANELHDTLLQSLSGSAMQIRAGVSHLKQGSPHAALDRLNAALEQMGRSQSDARQAIWELTATELNGNRLAEALEAQANELCSEGPKLQYRVSGTIRRLRPGVEEQLYRVCMEAVTNAVRHSGATKIAVGLNFSTTYIQLSVEDDGCGFDLATSHSANGTHFGLKSMQQRAERCGGKLSVESTIGQGTKVALEVPVYRLSHEDA
ncbi:MAG: hypothetical protein JO356_00405 [Acidobacteria bacterium]|nr:hypothetical protein [Acidobacteriota bacterium]